MATKAKLQEQLAKAGNTLTLQTFAEKVLKPIGVGESKCKKGVLKGGILSDFIDVFAAIYAAGGETVNNGEDDAIKSLAKMKILGSKYKSGGKLGSTLKTDIAAAISGAEGLKRKATKAATDLGTIVGVEFTFTTIDEEDGDFDESPESFVDEDDFSVLGARLQTSKKFIEKNITQIETGLIEFEKDPDNADAAAKVNAALALKDTFAGLMNELIALCNDTSADKDAILAKTLEIYAGQGKTTGFFGTNGSTLLGPAISDPRVAGSQEEVFGSLLEVLKDISAQLSSST